MKDFSTMIEPAVPLAAKTHAPVSSLVSITPIVLVLNTGSRTLKFSVFKEHTERPLFTGQIEGLDDGELFLRLGKGLPVRLRAVAAHTDPLDIAMAALRTSLPSRLSLVAISHRIVHGGETFVEPMELDEDALLDLQLLTPFAPLHQVHNLAGVRAARRQWPKLPQIGCFDTAFHSTMPETERRLPLPEALDDAGLRRYGCHGLSFENMVRSLHHYTDRIRGRALLAHLGAGASLCATASGRSVGTSMGLSSLDGLMMGTRCGSMDVGVILHLLRQGWTLEQLEHLLYTQSGLKGVSGLSSRLTELRTIAMPQAQLAVNLHLHRAIREAGGLIALMGGIDLLVFSGTLGNQDAELRSSWVQRLAFLGMKLDAQSNALDNPKTPMPLHHPESTVEVWVVPCDEGCIAALAAWKRLNARPHKNILPPPGLSESPKIAATVFA